MSLRRTTHICAPSRISFHARAFTSSSSSSRTTTASARRSASKPSRRLPCGQQRIVQVLRCHQRYIKIPRKLPVLKPIIQQMHTAAGGRT